MVKADKEGTAEAAAALKAGRVVILPTETVYGLAVDLGQPTAVERMLALRGNPGVPRIVWHAPSVADAKLPACGVVGRMIRKFWPGPLTIIPANGEAVRVPNHEAAIAIIKAAGVRVGATAACRPDRKPAVTAEEAAAQFDGAVDLVVDGGPSKHKVVSTAVRVAGARLDVVREGAIPRSVLDEVNVAIILMVCSGNTCRSPMAERLMRRTIARKLGVADGDVEARGFRIVSAGTGAVGGMAASDEAVDAMKEMGIDLSDHRSTPLSRERIEEADRVYVMSRSHLRTVQEQAPDCAPHIQLLDPDGGDVSDPFGSALSNYRDSLRRIGGLVEKRAGELLP